MNDEPPLTCDSCGFPSKKPLGVEIRQVPINHHSGEALCEPCFRREIAWRVSRNKAGEKFDADLDWNNLGQAFGKLEEQLIRGVSGC